MPIDFGNQPNSTVSMGDPGLHATANQYHPHAPNDRFLLATHPMAWDLIDGELLPSVRSLPLALGVNGTNGRGNSAGMQAGAMQNGWTVLSPSDPKVGDYGVGTPVRGGTHWHTKWERLNSRSGRKLPSVVDSEGFNRWRRGLVADGVVPPPSEDALALHADRLARRRDRRADAVTEYGKRQLRRAEESVDDLASAAAPGEVPRKAKGSLLSGNASKDRASAAASEDVDALKAALVATKHKTVEAVIRERLAKLGGV